MAINTMDTTCCVVGGGPAGIMLGYLLARAGVPVTVLEKHADFLRDFRGDTVHSSTLEILHELDLLDDFLKCPHRKIYSAGGVFGGYRFMGPDFSHLPAHSKFVALMPQWDFLNFLSGRAREFRTFDLRTVHEAVDLIHEGDRIAGVVARGPDSETVNIRASLVIGCDGRHSRTRTAGQLDVDEFGVPIDVLWFRLSRRAGDPQNVLGTVNFGKALILLDRGDYFQAGMIIRKGGFDEIKQNGLDAFCEGILDLAPYFDDRVEELRDWDQVKLLTVQINRLRKWYRPGLLCIGDAAHAMSPAGGVGINLAVQDAVAAANLLADPLRLGAVSELDLAAVQKRREFPARAIQAAQLRIHNGLNWIFENPGPAKAPWQLKVVVQIPGIHRALGYAVAMGVRPEHVRNAANPHVPLLSRVAIAIGGTLGRLAARLSSAPRLQGRVARSS